jgi:hypothetical protein
MWHHHFVAFFLIALVCQPALADEISVSKAGFDLKQDRLAELFHIQQMHVDCTASQPYRSATLLVDCYRDGKKVLSDSIGLTSTTDHESISVSCQFTDLDRLPLGPVNPGHVRVSMKIKSPSGFAAREFDIVKKQCDVSKINGVGHWSVSGEKVDGPTPLYYQLRSTNNSVRFATTLEDLLQSNPAADVLVVSLSLNDNKK